MVCTPSTPHPPPHRDPFFAARERLEALDDETSRRACDVCAMHEAEQRASASSLRGALGCGTFAIGIVALLTTLLLLAVGLSDLSRGTDLFALLVLVLLAGVPAGVAVVSFMTTRTLWRRAEEPAEPAVAARHATIDAARSLLHPPCTSCEEAKRRTWAAAASRVVAQVAVAVVIGGGVVLMCLALWLATLAFGGIAHA